MQFEVSVTVPDNTTIADLREYIKEAVSCWGGQYPTDHPLFSANWDNDKVKVKRILNDEG